MDSASLLADLKVAKEAGDEDGQISALNEICTYICIGAEDWVRGLDATAYVKVLVELLKTTPPTSDVCVLTIRGFALILDIVPRSCPMVINAGVVPILLNMLQPGSGALSAAKEEVIKAMEKVSLEDPQAVLKGGGLLVLFDTLEKIPFEREGIHLRILHIVSNICSRLQQSDWKHVEFALNVLIALMSSCIHEDRNTVEEGDHDAHLLLAVVCTCVAHILDRFGLSDPLLENINSSGLINCLLSVLHHYTFNTAAHVIKHAVEVKSSVYKLLGVIHSTNRQIAQQLFLRAGLYRLLCSTLKQSLQVGGPGYTSTNNSSTGSSQLHEGSIGSASLFREEHSVGHFLHFLTLTLPPLPPQATQPFSLLQPEILVPYHNWKWEDDFHNLTDYDMLVSHRIECEYYKQKQTGALKTMEVSVSTRSYTLNFDEMRQVNKSSRLSRPVYRDPLPHHYTRKKPRFITATNTVTAPTPLHCPCTHNTSSSSGPSVMGTGVGASSHHSHNQHTHNSRHSRQPSLTSPSTSSSTTHHSATRTTKADWVSPSSSGHQASSSSSGGGGPSASGVGIGGGSGRGGPSGSNVSGSSITTVTTLEPLLRSGNGVERIGGNGGHRHHHRTFSHTTGVGMGLTVGVGGRGGGGTGASSSAMIRSSSTQNNNNATITAPASNNSANTGNNTGKFRALCSKVGSWATTTHKKCICCSGEDDVTTFPQHNHVNSLNNALINNRNTTVSNILASASAAAGISVEEYTLEDLATVDAREEITEGVNDALALPADVLLNLVLHTVPIILQLISSTINCVIVHDCVNVLSRILYCVSVSCNKHSPYSNSMQQHTSSTQQTNQSYFPPTASALLENNMQADPVAVPCKYVTLLTEYMGKLCGTLVGVLSSCSTQAPSPVDRFPSNILCPALFCCDMLMLIDPTSFTPCFLRHGLSTSLRQILHVGHSTKISAFVRTMLESHLASTMPPLDRHVNLIKEDDGETAQEAWDYINELNSLCERWGADMKECTADAVAGLLADLESLAYTKDAFTAYELLHKDSNLLPFLLEHIQSTPQNLSKVAPTALAFLGEMLQTCLTWKIDLCPPSKLEEHTFLPSHVSMQSWILTTHSPFGLSIQDINSPRRLQTAILHAIAERVGRPLSVRIVPCGVQGCCHTYSVESCDFGGDYGSGDSSPSHFCKRCLAHSLPYDEILNICIYPFVTFGALEHYLQKHRSQREIEREEKDRDSPGIGNIQQQTAGGNNNSSSTTTTSNAVGGGGGTVTGVGRSGNLTPTRSVSPIARHGSSDLFSSRKRAKNSSSSSSIPHHVGIDLPGTPEQRESDEETSPNTTKRSAPGPSASSPNQSASSIDIVRSSASTLLRYSKDVLKLNTTAGFGGVNASSMSSATSGTHTSADTHPPPVSSVPDSSSDAPPSPASAIEPIEPSLEANPASPLAGHTLSTQHGISGSSSSSSSSSSSGDNNTPLPRATTTHSPEDNDITEHRVDMDDQTSTDENFQHPNCSETATEVFDNEYELLMDGVVIPRGMTLLDAIILHTEVATPLRSPLDVSVHNNIHGLSGSSSSSSGGHGPHVHLHHGGRTHAENSAAYTCTIFKTLLNRIVSLWSTTFTITYRKRSAAYPPPTILPPPIKKLGSEYSETEQADSTTTVLECLHAINVSKPENSTMPKLCSALMHHLTNQPTLYAFPSLQPFMDKAGQDITATVWQYPSLFPLSVRQTLFDYTSFGARMSITKALHSRTISATHQHQDIPPPFTFGRALVGNDWLKAPKHKLLVERDDVLQCAIEGLRQHASSPLPLDVYFSNEHGTGLGPTTEFYALVSCEIQRIDFGLWRHQPINHLAGVTVNNTDVDITISSGLQLSTDHAFSSTGSTQRARGASKEEDYVNAPHGLFPCLIPTFTPMAPKQHLPILRNFMFLGRFIARALREGRTLDMDVSPLFISLLLGKDLCENPSKNMALLDPELEHSLRKLQNMLDDATACSTAELPVLEQDISNLCLEFTLPGQPEIELIADGASVAVTLVNLSSYIDLVRRYHLHTGIEQQMRFFMSAFDEVFPHTHLQLFTHTELTALLTGKITDKEKMWNSEGALLSDIICDHGYTYESRPIKFLIQVVSSWPYLLQRKFLAFISGSPRMPSVGLNPKLTVVKRDTLPTMSATGNHILTPDDYLPTCNTCFHYLKLPEYSCKQVLESKLLTAIHDGQESFDLS